MTTLAQWFEAPLPPVADSGVSLSSDFAAGDAILFEQAAGEACRAYLDYGQDVTEVRARIYFRTPEAWASSSKPIAMGAVGFASGTWRILLSGSTTPGSFRFSRFGGADQDASPANTMALNTWYRAEVRVDLAGESGEVDLFALGSDTPLWSGSVSGYFGDYENRLILGPSTVSPTLPPIRIGHVLVDDTYSTTLLGRVAADTVTSTIVDWAGGTLPTVVGTSPVVDGDELIFEQTNTTDYLQWITAATDVCSVRFYLRTPASWATSATDIFRAQAGASSVNARISLAGTGAPGSIRFIQAGAEQVANSPNNTLALDTWYRVELQVDGVTQQLRGTVYLVGSRWPIYDSGWVGDDTAGGDMDRFRLGKTVGNSTLPDFRVRDIRVDDKIRRIGPADGEAVIPPTFTVWDGETAVPVSIVGVWDGASVQPLA